MEDGRRADSARNLANAFILFYAYGDLRPDLRAPLRRRYDAFDGDARTRCRRIMVDHPTRHHLHDANAAAQVIAACLRSPRET